MYAHVDARGRVFVDANVDPFCGEKDPVTRYLTPATERDNCLFCSDVERNAKRLRANTDKLE